MAKFKVDNEQIDITVEKLRTLLKECEELYDKKVPISDVDKGQTHEELISVCENIRTTCFYCGQLIHNTIEFLGKSSEMFAMSDTNSANAIKDGENSTHSGGSGSTHGGGGGRIHGTFKLETYLKNATDADYAQLCYLSYRPNGNKKYTEKDFYQELQEKLSAKNPLKSINQDQISISRHKSGFSAITISDGNSAIVIFSGTDGDVGDYVADAQLAIPALPSSEQSKQARKLIDELSKTHTNITVTGHSLGGFLATSTTLHNDSISRCIAFDPPGRYDTGYQETNNTERFAKVTTYEAKGSIISAVGSGVGDVKKIDVESNGNYIIDQNHGIKQIYEKLKSDYGDSNWNHK